MRCSTGNESDIVNVAESTDHQNSWEVVVPGDGASHPHSNHLWVSLASGHFEWYWCLHLDLGSMPITSSDIYSVIILQLVNVAKVQANWCQNIQSAGSLVHGPGTWTAGGISAFNRPAPASRRVACVALPPLVHQVTKSVIFCIFCILPLLLVHERM